MSGRQAPGRPIDSRSAARPSAWTGRRYRATAASRYRQDGLAASVGRVEVPAVGSPPQHNYGGHAELGAVHQELSAARRRNPHLATRRDFRLVSHGGKYGPLDSDPPYVGRHVRTGRFRSGQPVPAARPAGIGGACPVEAPAVGSRTGAEGIPGQSLDSDVTPSSALRNQSSRHPRSQASARDVRDLVQQLTVNAGRSTRIHRTADRHVSDRTLP